MRNKQNNRQAIKASIIVLSCMLFLLFSPVPSHADDSLPIPSPTITPSDYKLPYPGLLPDSPLYFLKSVRDNIVGFFIGKPLEKADFMLLQSDKQVSASYMLVNQANTKTDLAVATFSQGQDAFDEAIEQTKQAHKQGINVVEMTKKLADANQKHLQVLDQINQQVSTADKSKFQKVRDREKAFTNQVKSLQH